MHSHGNLWIVWLWVGTVAAAPMSGDAVLRKSADAYASLTSFVGMTLARDPGPASGPNPSSQATANITFSRPGKLHSVGYGVNKQGHALISDGKDTWFAETNRNAGAYEQAPSVEQALAALAGSTLAAPAPISALLLDLAEGHPYRGVTGSRINGEETLDGKNCYRVVGVGKGIRRTYWIDSSTFMLRQMKEEADPPSTASGRDAAAPSPRLYTFAIRQINQPVDVKQFQPPTGRLDLLSIPSGGGRILEK